MATAPVLPIDLRQPAPRASLLAQAVAREGLTRGLRGMPGWDPDEWPVSAGEPLDGLSELMERWSESFEARPRRHPGTELLLAIEASWPEPSYERRFFRRAVEKVRSFQPATLLDQARLRLEGESRTADQLPPAHASFYRTVIAAIRDCERALERHRDVPTTAIVAGNAERGAWTLENLKDFMTAVLAIDVARRDLADFIVARDAALAASLGSVPGSPGLADSHDDLE